EKGKEHAVFTGDTLFVGDVGRPDLLDGNMSKEALAGMMFDSLNNKIKPLLDEVIVYPGHGPGSACGKNIGKETFSTIGEQKRTNYALQEMSKEDFISRVTEGILPPPKYFFEDAKINKKGYRPIEEVVKANLNTLSVNEVEELQNEGVVILDTRKPDDFEKGHIKGALNIGLNGQYAVWVGTLLNIGEPLIVIAEEGKEEEAMIRLARIGYESVKGYLAQGMKAWEAESKKVDTVKSVSPEKMKELYEQGTTVLDVRKEGEFESGHVKGAKLLTLSDLELDSEKLDKEETYLVHCAGGYRSMIASSLLQRKGFGKVINVYKGFGAIRETGIEIVN
ncbi:rhodanese-like domain-containing protein, partial [Xanthovirga aplysinae]|uniref:rhodanese-like domain-containing protein n=1 Tax=Xanthovirga aplysinae TaxID=2529853 RepID=UPI0012BBC5BD